MNYRRRLGLLILNMTTVSLVVAGINIYTLYQTAFEQQKQKLMETAQSQARLIEEIAQTNDNPDIILQTFVDGYEKFNNLAQTVEFTLVKREKNQIMLLIPHQHNNYQHFHSLPWESNLAKPMREVLSGKSGVMSGLDYRGVKVLAAYEPVTSLNWGIIVKIDLAELNSPFLIAGIYTIATAAIVNLIGAILFLGIGKPKVPQLEGNEAYNQVIEELKQERNFVNNILETTSNLIIVIDQNSEIIRINRACEEITHYAFAEIKNKNFEEIFLGIEELASKTFLERLQQGQFPEPQQSVWLTKEKEPKIITWSPTVIFNSDETIKYIIITGIDISERVSAEEELTRLNQQLENRVRARTTELQNSNEQLRLEISERQRLEEALRRELDLLARIMETSPVGIIMVNSNGDIILASEQGEQILGLRQAERQKPHNISEWKIFDEEGNLISEEESPFYRVIQSRLPVSDVHYIVQLPNSQQILLSINASPLLNTEDKIEGVVLIIEDITERVQVEAALIHSEAQFRAVFEQAAVGIGIITLEGQFIRVNQRYCQLLGYSEAELLGKSYAEITHPDDLSKNQKFTNQLLSGEMQTGSLEKRYIRKDSEIQWVNLTASAVSDTQGNLQYLIGIVEDISERKRTEEALRDSEERFRSIFNQAAVGIVQMGLSGQFILVNDKFVDIIQYSAAQLQQKTFQEITHSDDLEQEINYIRQMIEGTIDDFSLEKRYVRQDSSLVWVNLSSSVVRNTNDEPMYFINIVEDISERKKAIKDLRQSEEQYRRIIETTAEGVWIIDRDHLTTFVNQRMAEMLGYSIEEIKGGSILEFIASEQQKMAANRLERRQGVTEYHDLKFLRKDGTDLWTMITTNPIYDAMGNYIGALGMFTDITERKKTEETLQQVNEQLTARVTELEQRHQDILLLNQVNDFLQACLNIEEAYQVIGELLKPLFPGCSGGLFMLNNSQTVIELVVAWGEDSYSKTLFTCDECWALRRGYIHWVKSTQPSLFCLHTNQDPAPMETLCVPMMAQGQSVGLFYLSSSESKKISDVKQQLARAVSEHISLALVNLQLRASLESQSIKDALTNLYNRRYMEESLKREISLAQRKQHSVGLIMLDVDHFKRFNDTFGHKVGDLVLREVSNFLINNVRTGDIACRYGGEEFLLILPEASLDDSQQRAEQIRKGIKQLNFKRYNQSFHSITISLGVACFPEHGKNSDNLIHAADTALLQAKKQGRDRVIVFSPSMEL